MRKRGEILKVFKEQMAIDYNCTLEEIDKRENVITTTSLNEGRRKYEEEGFKFQMLCYNNKIVVSTTQEMIPWCEERLKNVPGQWIFEFENLRAIDDKLNEYNQEIGDIHHYYLPFKDTSNIKPIAEVKWYEQGDIEEFRGDDRFQEAFAFDDAYPDVLAVSAIDDKGNIMAMAGASRDCNELWQIGIDVLPVFRGRGLGTNLVILLKNEILNRGKVPYYGTVGSHFHSQNIAINAGFKPAWAEVYSQAKL